MALSDLDVKEVFNGDGIVTDFVIPFDFTDNAVIKVYLIDELTADTTTRSGFAETLQTISTHYNLDADPATQVEMITAPTTDEKLMIIRETPLTQPTDHSDDVLEEDLDNIVRMIQELDEKVDFVETKADAAAPASASAGAIPDWATATAYLIDQVVYHDTKLYRAVTDHTSNTFSTDLINGDLEEIYVRGAQGTQGVKGDKGDIGATGAAGATGATGATGAAGTNGTNGTNGTSGIITALASQAEAQAGLENTKGMTPLRVAEAIAAQVDEAGIVTNAADIAAANTAAGLLTTRVSLLEDETELTTLAGKQRCNNNQTALDMDAAAGQAGLGDGLQLNKVGAKSARVTVESYREDDAEVRASLTVLLLHNINDTWYMAVESVTTLAGNPDGLTFSITEAAGVVQVQYASDNMSGGNYKTTSYIHWRLKELSAL